MGGGADNDVSDSIGIEPKYTADNRLGISNLD